MKKIIVLSLGGSLIVPEEINHFFLKSFKQVLKKNSKYYKFVVVTGGGMIARKYISVLANEKLNHKIVSMAGISATRMNARFMTYFFGDDANEGIPHDMSQVRNLLKKNNVVFCGALRYADKETSDGTAAKLANYLKSDFINITNVSGLYDKDPKKHKNAKFISKISWKEFDKMLSKMKFKPGQHFVLDQQAAKIIKKHMIKTIIIGPNLNNLDNILKNKKFKGTIIEG